MNGKTMKKISATFLVAFLLCLVAVWPTAAAKTSAPFPPGTWRGKGIWTGAISNGQISAVVARPGIMSFEVQVAPDGTVTGGQWSLDPTDVNVDAPSIGVATGNISGMGGLGGTGSNITINGTDYITVDIPSLGVSGIEVDLPASGSFWATTVSCTFVQGDLANVARDEQKAAGFSTSVVSPFTAIRISAPGEKGNESWDETYVALVEKMMNVTGKPKPTAKELSDLVSEIGKFQAGLVKAASCADAPKNLEKGKQPYTWFVEKFTEMLNKILGDPSGYTGADISEMLFAAVQTGAVGSAAPDQEAARVLEDQFREVLTQKLNEDIANGNKNDALLIYLAAKQAGYKDLAGQAHQFAL